GGAGGKVTFNPLHLSFTQPELNAALFQLLAGDPLRQVDVLGYTINGDSSHLAVDYTFGFALGQKLSVDQTGVSHFDLAYGTQTVEFNDNPPVAVNDLAGVTMGKAVSGDVLANDHDPDGDAIQVTGIAGGSLGQGVAGAYGTLILMSDGTYTYTSDKNAHLPAQGVAQDSFLYTESDGLGGTAQATLNVTVLANGTNYVAGTPGATLSTAN